MASDQDRKTVAALAEHGHDSDWVACYSLFRHIDEQDSVIGNGLQTRTRGNFLATHLLHNHVGNGSNLLVRREVALELGGFDPTHAERGMGGCEDFDFQLRLLRRHKIELVREYLVGYRQHPGAMSGNQRAMARAAIHVVESNVEDPSVPATHRHAARFRAHYIAARRLQRVRAWADIGRLLMTMAASLRPGSVALLARLALRKKRKDRSRARAAKNGSALRQPFASYDPLDGLAD